MVSFPNNSKSLQGRLNALLQRWFGCRVVRQDSWEAMMTLVYRHRLLEAEKQGRLSFLQDEARRNQLTARDLRRLARHHTPMDDWPEESEGLVSSDDDNVNCAADTECRARI